jgi:formylmethanofuran dehydrogenase subunit D
MPEGKLTLITGRSTKQGMGISTGKGQSEYAEATTFVELSQADMSRWGLTAGDTVRLTSEYGEVTVKCRAEDLPEGMAFMAFGPAANRLTGSQTHLSGMPDTKSVEIELSGEKSET